MCPYREYGNSCKQIKWCSPATLIRKSEQWRWPMSWCRHLAVVQPKTPHHSVGGTGTPARPEMLACVVQLCVNFNRWRPALGSCHEQLQNVGAEPRRTFTNEFHCGTDPPPKDAGARWIHLKQRRIYLRKSSSSSSSAPSLWWKTRFSHDRRRILRRSRRWSERERTHPNTSKAAGRTDWTGVSGTRFQHSAVFGYSSRYL